jgi:RNA polymerase sigma-70 factor (ECF subfamily)
VAVNTVLMHSAKGLRRYRSTRPTGTKTGVPKREHGKVDGRLSTSVDRIALTRAMKELPAGYRTIFLLHEVKGYEHHEIARLLSCSVGNSKSQLHKAKMRMRELLGWPKGSTSPRTVNSTTAMPATDMPVEAMPLHRALEIGSLEAAV